MIVSAYHADARKRRHKVGAINLGKKPSQTMEMPSNTAKNKVYYPELTVHDIDLGVSDKDAGKAFTAIIKGTIRRVSNTARADGSKDMACDLEVHSIDFGDSVGKKGTSKQKQVFDSFYHKGKKG